MNMITLEQIQQLENELEATRRKLSGANEVTVKLRSEKVSSDIQIEKLIKENAELIKDNEEKSKKIEILESQLKESQKRLRVYENPNTPPSQQRIKEKKEEKKPSNGTRGAPKGHKGTTREYKDPDETILVDNDKCVKCGSVNIHELE